MLKYPKEIKLPHTDEQAQFAAEMSAELTRRRGSHHKVPVRAVWRLFNDCCRHNREFFLDFVSTYANISTDEGTQP